MYQLSATCNSKRNEIAYLKNQIQVLEGYVNGLKNYNQQQEVQNKSYTYAFLASASESDPEDVAIPIKYEI